MGRDNCGTSGAVRGEMVFVFIGIHMQCVHTINTRSILQYRGEGVGVGTGGWRDYQVFHPTTRVGQGYFGV